MTSDYRATVREDHGNGPPCVCEKLSTRAKGKGVMTLRGDEVPPIPVLGDLGIDEVEDANKNKGVAIVGYIGILFLVPLLTAKESPFAMYHANQGLVLFLFGMALGVVGMIPLLGLVVLAVGGIAHLVLLIMGIINAAQGVKKPLPLIGGIKLL